ncbi:Glu-tRNA(Gln) amidotransferase subunit GatD [Candidatus Woesearchaeota archaeon]|nr:Glu-tRNA(Gln) amidotransferase subunit GatD [Candidatus Woesearchaeota archaeon]
MAKPGERVRIEYDDKEAEGVLMLSQSDDSVFVKLDSGYNIGIDRSRIKEIRSLGKVEKKDLAKKKPETKKGLKKIVVLHTGGTIASKVDYSTGGVIAKFSAEDLIGMFPELDEIANIETELIANMMSEDMRFSDHQKIAAAVRKHAEKGADGIIIGHGTDTLGYTSASLAFMFDKINIPVMIVGSQRSSDRPSTDAAMNLICAARFIADSSFIGFAVCMHDSSSDDKCAILPATKTRKMHTSRRDAFRAINDDPIALVDYRSGNIEMMKDVKNDSEEIVLKDSMESSVALLKTHPNMDPAIFEFCAKQYRGMVLEVTGLGQAPTNLGEDHLKIHKILKDYIAKGGIVGITSQCIYGRVHPDIYTNCRRLADIGCIFLEDMLPETAFVKLAWLLGNHSTEEAKEMLAENLRGEITERTEFDKEF